MLLPYSTANWCDFFDFVGRPEMVDDVRFASQRARIANSDELYGMLGGLAVDLHTAELLEFCDAHSVPVAEVLAELGWSGAQIDGLTDDHH